MLIYLLIINIIAFIMYGIDKWKAHRKQWRISEKMLLFLAVIGGSAGALAGMYIFHHKTLHKKFTIGVPLILVIQVMIFICIMEVLKFGKMGKYLPGFQRSYQTEV